MTFTVDSDSVAAYAALLGVEAAVEAPPLYAALPLNDAVAPVLESLVPPDVRARVVHRAHELRVARPLRVGERVSTVASVARFEGPVAEIATETRGEDGALVNEQLLTLHFRGSGGAARRPEAAVPDDALVTRLDLPVSLTERYADVSGDRFAIHLDDEAARAVGLPGRILHGLCTLALAARAVVDGAGATDGDVRRVAAQFTAPVQPGTADVAAWQDGGAWRFSIAAAGRAALRDGVVELV